MLLTILIYRGKALESFLELSIPKHNHQQHKPAAMWNISKPPGWMVASSIISIGGLLNGYTRSTERNTKSKLIDGKVRHGLDWSSNHDAVLRAHYGNSHSSHAWFRCLALTVNGCYTSRLRGSTGRPVWSASHRDGRSHSIHSWCCPTSSMRWAPNAAGRKSFSRIGRGTMAFERISVRRADAIDLRFSFSVLTFRSQIYHRDRSCKP